MAFSTDPVLDTVTLLLVCGTVALAIYTGKLHAATVALAGDTVEATRLADRHHQESLSPLCVIKSVTWEGDQRGQQVSFQIHNQGNGPAVEVKCTVTPRMESFERSQDALAIKVDSLQAGEETRSRMVSPFFGHTFEMAVVLLESKNQFGEWGRTRWTVLRNGTHRLDVLDLAAPKARALTA